MKISLPEFAVLTHVYQDSFLITYLEYYTITIRYNNNAACAPQSDYLAKKIKKALIYQGEVTDKPASNFDAGLFFYGLSSRL
jgi:hypothetical protein